MYMKIVEWLNQEFGCLQTIPLLKIWRSWNCRIWLTTDSNSHGDVLNQLALTKGWNDSGFLVANERFHFDLHPRKLTWQWKNNNLKIYLLLKRWFSIAMLVLWRVAVWESVSFSLPFFQMPNFGCQTILLKIFFEDIKGEMNLDWSPGKVMRI